MVGWFLGRIKQLSWYRLFRNFYIPIMSLELSDLIIFELVMLSKPHSLILNRYILFEVVGLIHDITYTTILGSWYDINLLV